MSQPHSTSKQFRPIGSLCAPAPRPLPAGPSFCHPSLQLLQPRRRAAGACSVQKKNATATTAVTAIAADPDATAADIIVLWKALLRAVHEGIAPLRDWDRGDGGDGRNSSSSSPLHPLFAMHVAPDFRCTQDFEPGLPSARSSDWATNVAVWRAALAALPACRVRELDGLRVELCQRSGTRARVWSRKELSGLPGGVCKEAVALSRWELRGGVWVITGVEMLRGVGGWM